MNKGKESWQLPHCRLERVFLDLGGELSDEQRQAAGRYRRHLIETGVGLEGCSDREVFLNLLDLNIRALEDIQPES